MNYSELSDFEINKRVASALGLESGNSLNPRDFELGEWLDMPEQPSPPDYCNSPEDAWPVIEQIWGKLHEPIYDSENKYADCVWNAYQSAYLCGPLKAAMICFLMMKESDHD